MYYAFKKQKAFSRNSVIFGAQSVSKFQEQFHLLYRSG